MADRSPFAGLFRHKAGLTLEDERSSALLDNVVDEGGALHLRLARPGVLVATSREASGAWFSGSLDFISVIELVTIIVGAHHTGVLEVQSGTGWRRLFFEDGRYTGSMSTFEQDRLGQVLWQMGRLSLDQVVIASEYMSEGKRIGRTLVELGFITNKDLRPALREQARLVFQAACVESVLTPDSVAVFRGAEKHPNPVNFFDETEGMVDAVLDVLSEVDALRVALGDLDRTVTPVIPAPQGHKLEERDEALLQLVASRRNRANPFTQGELLESAKFGYLAGLRSLHRLLENGFVVREEETAVADEEETRPAVDRLCEGVTKAMAALDNTGFGLGDSVRELVDSPPDEMSDAMSFISLDGPLDPAALKAEAQFIDGGVEALEKALSMVLDLAMFEARDNLDEDAVATLVDALIELDVFH